MEYLTFGREGDGQPDVFVVILGDRSMEGWRGTVGGEGLRRGVGMIADGDGFDVTAESRGLPQAVVDWWLANERKAWLSLVGGGRERRHGMGGEDCGAREDGFSDKIAVLERMVS